MIPLLNDLTDIDFLLVDFMDYSTKGRHTEDSVEQLPLGRNTMSVYWICFN